MKRKTFVILLATLLIAPLALYSWLFDIPTRVYINVIFNQNLMSTSLPCYEAKNPKFLDVNNRINLAVWNIYKQNRDDWQPFLSDLASDKQLVLLQEVALDDGFINWLADGSSFAAQANAFSVNGRVAGVLNLSQSQPKKVCATRASEPWILLPKSALYSLFPLSNGQELALVNIHSINFSIGVEEYLGQIKELAQKLSQHSGPIIFAGDFNTWNDSRMRVLNDVMDDLGLSEAIFEQDQRTRFINGFVLDHIFFRGLNMMDSKTIPTTASDHNPLVVSFDLRSE